MSLLNNEFALEKICSEKSSIRNFDLRQKDSLFGRGVVKGYSTLLDNLVHIYVERDTVGIYVIQHEEYEEENNLSDLQSLVHYQTNSERTSTYWSDSLLGIEVAAYIDVMLSLGLILYLTKEQKKLFSITPEVAYFLEGRAIRNIRLFNQLPSPIQQRIESKFEPPEALRECCLSDPLEDWLSNLREMKDFTNDINIPVF